MEAQGTVDVEEEDGGDELRRPDWADLNADILRRVARVSEFYSLTHSEWFPPVVRAVCSPWRAAMPPASSMFIYTAAIPGGGGGDDGRVPGRFASTFSLTLARQVELSIEMDVRLTLNAGRATVGSSGGWLAVKEEGFHGRAMEWILMHPVTGEKIRLPNWGRDDRWVGKLVFAPSPTPDSFTVVAIVDYNQLAYVVAGYEKRWCVVNLDGKIDYSDRLCDVVYHAGRFYCATEMGDMVVVSLPFPGGPRVDSLGRMFDPRSAFPAPYSTLYRHTASKHLVFCKDDLYQVWRNSVCTVTTAPAAPDANRRRYRVVKDDIFVLRFDPRRRDDAWWSEASDLGGHAVFIGKNNAVSVRADGGERPSVMSNCVYWIDSDGRAMVFDMATRTSKPCVQAAGVKAEELRLHRAICWYFVD
ncbi:hypothetical protein GUJ93_ZPchr0005g16159 [Zizania palustris]|uniref:KIB1-4 beta-propeller domain-containing protein n=1 Tax=Zizania palustris TaxID=103762 RepID=A0A8J5VHE6_ZIZPA|nr:hypothetical protein GUJ93_ZPchr0005g15940 [Zizania palustris]KAG8067725.1 hypothetical protein GUJ93_ZPchr0005g16159 [Zizania palustris]